MAEHLTCKRGARPKIIKSPAAIWLELPAASLVPSGPKHGGPVEPDRGDGIKQRPCGGTGTRPPSLSLLWTHLCESGPTKAELLHLPVEFVRQPRLFPFDHHGGKCHTDTPEAPPRLAGAQPEGKDGFSTAAQSRDAHIYKASFSIQTKLHTTLVSLLLNLI